MSKGDFAPHLDQIEDLPRQKHEQVYFSQGDFEYFVQAEHPSAGPWSVWVYRLVDWHQLGTIEQAAGDLAAAFVATTHKTHDRPSVVGEPQSWRDAIASLAAH